jgi:hypothetical protein
MKSYMKHTVVILMLVILISSGLHAGNKLRVGSAGAQELLIPVGARGIALGNSDLIFAEGAEAMYWNPAGTSRFSKDVEALFSHMQYIADINVDYGAVVVKAGDVGTFGVSLKSLSFGDIPVTTADYPDGTGQQYTPTYINASASFAKLLTDRISAGISATLISESIMSTSASGVGFNIGLQYFGLGIPELNLGIAVKNVGPNMKFSGADLLTTADATQSLRSDQNYSTEAASSQLPSLLEIGVGYSRKLDEQNSILIGGNFQNNNASDDVYGFGGEYNYDNLLFLRGSYLWAPQADNDLTGTNSYFYDYTVGAGLHHDVGGVDVAFDYAYRHVRFMSANNIITLRLGF